MAIGANRADQRVLGRIESDGGPSRGRVAVHAVIVGRDMRNSCVHLACGLHAIMAGHARGCANLGVIEERGFPRCGRMAIFAAQIRWNVGWRLGGQLALADGHGAVVAGQAHIADLAVIKHRRNPRREIGVAIRANRIVSAIDRNVHLVRASEHACGRGAIMAGGAIGNIAGLGMIKLQRGREFHRVMANIAIVRRGQMRALGILFLADDRAG